MKVSDFDTYDLKNALAREAYETRTIRNAVYLGRDQRTEGAKLNRTQLLAVDRRLKAHDTVLTAVRGMIEELETYDAEDTFNRDSVIARFRRVVQSVVEKKA